jgi:hypothetical protein
VASGTYVVGGTLTEADAKARAQYPDRVFSVVRVGRPAVHTDRQEARVRAYGDAYGAPRVERDVRGSRATIRGAALLDTGVDGEVSRPVGLAMQLGLALQDVMTVERADGSLSDALRNTPQGPSWDVRCGAMGNTPRRPRAASRLGRERRRRRERHPYAHETGGHREARGH